MDFCQSIPTLWKKYKAGNITKGDYKELTHSTIGGERVIGKSSHSLSYPEEREHSPGLHNKGGEGEDRDRYRDRDRDRDRDRYRDRDRDRDRYRYRDYRSKIHTHKIS